MKNSKLKSALKSELGINRKGFSMIAESDKILFWLIVVGVIALCMIFIISWTSTLKKIYLNEELAPTAYEARLIYSDECFAYKDAVTGRVYTGTIDPAKFTKNVLFKCLPLDGSTEHAISAKLETQDGKTVLYAESANWNLKTSDVTMQTYVVQVEGYGPGLLTFYHKAES